MASDVSMPMGKSRFGFFASWAVVLTASNPMYAKKTTPAPVSTPGRHRRRCAVAVDRDHLLVAARGRETGAAELEKVVGRDEAEPSPMNTTTIDTLTTTIRLFIVALSRMPR